MAAEYFEKIKPHSFESEKDVIPTPGEQVPVGRRKRLIRRNRNLTHAKSAIPIQRGRMDTRSLQNVGFLSSNVGDRSTSL